MAAFHELSIHFVRIIFVVVVVVVVVIVVVIIIIIIIICIQFKYISENNCSCIF